MNIPNNERFDETCATNGLQLLSSLDRGAFEPYMDSAADLSYRNHQKWESLDRTKRWVGGCAQEPGFQAFALSSEEGAMRAMLWLKEATDKDMGGEISAFMERQSERVGVQASEIVYCHNAVVDAPLGRQGLAMGLASVALRQYEARYPEGALFLCRINPRKIATMDAAAKAGCQSTGIYDPEAKSFLWWGVIQPNS